MPIRPKDMERILKKDGWIFKNQEGSHKHYIHPTKPGKVTIPFHSKELKRKTEDVVYKQAGLKKRR